MRRDRELGPFVLEKRRLQRVLSLPINDCINVYKRLMGGNEDKARLSSTAPIRARVQVKHRKKFAK